ncbi:MAG: DUF3160 domain-containing protein [Ignavibacteria bacterium]
MLKKRLLLSILSFFFLSQVRAQSGNFNINEYNSFLNTHKNLSTGQLLDMHPAGTFSNNININPGSALYFQNISSEYNLTEYEISLLQKNGFMVSERLSRHSFGEAFLDVYHKDLPVFISTDAILYALHMSYDNILKDVELGILIDKVKSLLQLLHSNLNSLNSVYSSNSEMQTMLRDVDVYLTVPRILLGEGISPYFPENSSRIDTILQMIEAEQGFVSYSLFSDEPVIMDWSQFKPRGHYTDEFYPQLAQYFRAMMWLGRIEIYLLSPSGTTDPAVFNDVKRQAIDAMLIEELFDLASARSYYYEIETILKFFIGESDNVTLPNLEYLKQAVNLNKASDLLDSLKLVEFQDTLKNQSFAYQLILSQILISDPLSPDSIVPASAFLLFGQRFIIDSYVTGSVVYDRISYNGAKICRLFPSTLDPMFAMGNDAAAQLLQPELDAYNYSSNLAALRYLIDSYEPEFWNSSIYNMWLNTIRKLNPPAERESLPAFMHTAAFWQEKLNTQLTSWTELRHDNLLYAKQSYTGGITCSYPYAYVEPFPEFFAAIKLLAETAGQFFESLQFGEDHLKSSVMDYYQNLYSISDTLYSIAAKELSSTPLNESEKNFLHTIIYDVSSGCGSSYNGWYPDLFYNRYQEGFMEMNALVADIHTTPTDCMGNIIGAITHVGTGPIHLGVFIAEHEGFMKTFVGPLFSYYEYRTENFLRLTDEEWAEQYLNSALRPSWVNIYLADENGGSRGEGLKLLTSIDDNKKKIIPETHLIARNYPNPFNPSTIISFSIPYDLTNSKTELIVYNIQGQVVKRLVDETLPSGNYLTRWDGRNDLGNQVTSGIYIYSLRVADKQVSGKMTMIK